MAGGWVFREGFRVVLEAFLLFRESELDPLSSEATPHQFGNRQRAFSSGISETLLLCCCRANGDEMDFWVGDWCRHALVVTDDP